MFINYWGLNNLDIPTTLLAEAFEAKLALDIWLNEGGHFIGGENQENVAC